MPGSFLEIQRRGLAADTRLKEANAWKDFILFCCVGSNLSFNVSNYESNSSKGKKN